jgi:hypothetical protein
VLFRSLLAIQPKLLEKHQLEIAFAPLVIPEEVVMHALWENISLQQAQQIAQIALLDTQPLQQEVLLPHLVVSALLAILAVHHQHLTLVDVLHALLARTNHQQAQLHAQNALLAIPQLLLERHSLVIAFAPLVIPK